MNWLLTLVAAVLLFFGGSEIFAVLQEIADRLQELQA